MNVTNSTQIGNHTKILILSAHKENPEIVIGLCGSRMEFYRFRRFTQQDSIARRIAEHKRLDRHRSLHIAGRLLAGAIRNAINVDHWRCSNDFSQGVHGRSGRSTGFHQPCRFSNDQSKCYPRHKLAGKQQAVRRCLKISL